MSDLRDLLVCRACRGTPYWRSDTSCAACSSAYRPQDGIPALVAEPAEGVTTRQVAWFEDCSFRAGHGRIDFAYHLLRAVWFRVVVDLRIQELEHGLAAGLMTPDLASRAR